MPPEAINDNTPENNISPQKTGGEIFGNVVKQVEDLSEELSPEVIEESNTYAKLVADLEIKRAA